VNENLPEFGRPVDVIPKETEGTNAYLYWTCTKLGEDFIRLPDVTPLQIKTARTLTKLLTGNLDVLQLSFHYLL
jgi:radial spoke head protein 4A